MTSLRLQRLDALVKEISIEEDPERLIRVFTRQSDMVVQRDGLLTVTRRGVQKPQYRITRSHRWPVGVNPWTESHLLPVRTGGILGKLLYAGVPVLVNDLEISTDDPAFDHLEGMRSLACAPAYDKGLPVDMVAIMRREGGAFSPEDLETLLLNVNLFNQAVGNLHLSHQLREANQLLDQEKEHVGRMQRHLLPRMLPRIPGLDLAASYHTCSRAGGDYYDVLPLPDDQWGLFIADVSGHGTPAAVVMAMIHTLLHAFPGPAMPAVHVLAHLNRHLLSVAPEGMFATAFYGIYDPQYRRLLYANAGHPLPRVRRTNGTIQVLERTNGLPLGVVSEDTWSEREIRLMPGDALLLFTDGIIEAANQLGEQFGLDRLHDALRMAPLRAAPLVQHVERQYRDFSQGAPVMDDRTLLAALAVP